MKTRLAILVLMGLTASHAWSQHCSLQTQTNGSVDIHLDALPGYYALQTSTNLEEGWVSEAQMAVGTACDANCRLPLLERPHLFIRAIGPVAPTGAARTAQFWTQGATFEPEVDTESALLCSLLWTWSDATTSSDYPTAFHDFGTPAERIQTLSVTAPEALTALNLGFDASDGGKATPLSRRPPQQVSAIYFPRPLTGLRYFAASHNPLTNTLDFTGFTALEAIECYHCPPLQEVRLTNLPSLRRICIEESDLQALDLSGNPALEDVRVARNSFTEIVADRGTGPAIWHWNSSDNPQLSQSLQPLMSNFFALRELTIWGANQSGHLAPVSTNLMFLQAEENHYLTVDLSGQAQLVDCVLSGNQLTNLTINGCTALQIIDAHGNRLGKQNLDMLLEFLDTSAPQLFSADFQQNASALSSDGYFHYSNLVARGVYVYVDWPHMFDGQTNVAGGADAITFVTTNRHPYMEIQLDCGTPTNIIWHWGDGRIDDGTPYADHDFGAAEVRTNYIEVQPPGCVTFFGADTETPFQGIRAVYNASNFPALDTLSLADQGLTELSLADCAQLRHIHLTDNPASSAACDQWFIDLDVAVTGPVTNALFEYPAGLRSPASDAACSNLTQKGFTLLPL